MGINEDMRNPKPVPKVEFDPSYAPPTELLLSLNYQYLKREQWVPLEQRGEEYVVLMADPSNLLLRDRIEQILKTRRIKYLLASAEDIDKFIDHFFGLEEIIADRETDSVIVRMVDKIINEACERKASDIHIEPDINDQEVQVRFRIDGECIPYKSLPFSYRSPIVSRIKIMANLDITERRLPQDGKIKFKRPDGEEIELRVATIPTHGGVEDVVLRILTRGKILSLEDLQMKPEDHRRFLEALKKPYGLILIVGPTGSGKTTTAHAALQFLNKPNVKIWTAEDPVEIAQKGLRQVQVHHKIGYDFSHAMRAFLRADPDIIMVGEMRDYETAKTGIEASLTGHLVLSTLHTNNAPETIVRLLDMGIDPFAFADSIVCVLAQRLVRTLCPTCRHGHRPSKEDLSELSQLYGETFFTDFPEGDFQIYRPTGCKTCNKTGYQGRKAIFELLMASDEIKQLIIGRKSVAEIRKAAMAGGMRTLLQDGIRRVVNGETDLTEVLSVCIK